MAGPAAAKRSSTAAAMLLLLATVVTWPLLASAQPAPSMPPPSTPAAAAAANNSRLEKAYVALQRAITDDPKKLTCNWCGPDVCGYFGVFCAPAPDGPCQRTVAGVDLNHGDLARTLPDELGLLSDLAVFHLNSNRFSCSLPQSLRSLHLLHEIDVSNNQLSGGFPSQLLRLPNLQYVDIRGISSCIPPEIGKLDKLTVLDLSFNSIAGTLPGTIGNMRALEQLNVTHNMLAGEIPETICELPHLKHFTYSYNFFCGEPHRCFEVPRIEDRQNCIAHRPDQRSGEEGIAFLHRSPVHCDAHGCIAPPKAQASPPPVY